jgi:hypothetical protein
LGRWTLICTISAAPSFFWGCAINRGPHAIAGMLAGIFVFVLGYTLIECTYYYQQIITRPYVHRTALIGYGTRILISVIFPIGLFVDMFTGMLSVSFIESIFATSERGPNAGFLPVFLTTLVQGVLLNALLLVYIFGVYACLRVFSTIRQKLRQSDQPDGDAGMASSR